MKHDYKKHEKELYGTKMPTIITVPEQKFIMISGKGNPNHQDFSDRVGVLYSLAYPIKMNFKKYCACNPVEGNKFEYEDYTVFPLEGVWSSESKDPTDKDKFIYTIMIRQPDFITEEMVDEALESVKKKKHHKLLDEISFGTIEDGLSVQMLHLGSFDDEPESFAKMNAFVLENGYNRVGYIHREIYLNDARKTPPEKRHTILRYKIQNEKNY